ncbi:MAG: hypothetical protein MI919_08445, partial [Holophagales bacterium]|nr:hypothetical protein [Holophagales bacterium]
SLPEGQRAELFLTTHRRLQQAGWLGYEVSSFARSSEHISRHNRKYWLHVPYLGLGPSAHSLAIDSAGGLWRTWNEPAEPRWRKLVAAGTSPAAGWERLSLRALALEALMLGLRHRGGLDLESLEQRFDLDLEPRNRHRFEAWAESGYVERKGRRLVPTVQGMAVADRLATEVELG